jgi:hypothetical protein
MQGKRRRGNRRRGNNAGEIDTGYNDAAWIRGRSDQTDAGEMTQGKRRRENNAHPFIQACALANSWAGHSCSLDRNGRRMQGKQRRGD